jgi:exodeoxyribonuclease-5
LEEAWQKTDHRRLRGTGKSVVIAEAVKLLRTQSKRRVAAASWRIAFACYTGKAAAVLKNKLMQADALRPDDSCTTIHSLIYQPKQNENGEVIGWDRVQQLDYDLLVIDEASMVTQDIDRDLSQYGVPILYVGDHGQLPPIGDGFNLMGSPEIRLEKIFRQAEDSPIIKLSMMARLDGYIPVGEYGQYVRKVTDPDIIDRIPDLDGATILCGYNKFRVATNKRVRALMGRVGQQPLERDRVICLRNNKEAGIYNGLTGRISKLEDFSEKAYWMEVEFDGGHCWEGKAAKEQFGNETTLPFSMNAGIKDPSERIEVFDWAWVLSVWKAQGSEWPRVIVFEQRNSYQDDDNWRRWLYTAVTRSSDRLLIIGN